MENLVRSASFHIALLFCGFFGSLFAVGALVSFIPSGHSIGDNILALAIPFSLLFTAIYSVSRGAHQLEFWSNKELIPGSKKIAIGHLGLIFIVLAVAAMVNAKAGSGVVLAPALVWAAAFYIKGFKLIGGALSKEKNHSS